MVLFVTGLCSFHCFYCPVSDEKMYKDVVFADEKRVTRDEDVLEEAHAIQATGAGITGGDPLDAVERTCHYIRLLKHEFGRRFHTHLYTMSTDADKTRLPCASSDGNGGRRSTTARAATRMAGSCGRASSAARRASHAPGTSSPRTGPS